MKRLQWLSDNHLGENQLCFEYPADDILENLADEPNFDAFPFHEPLIPEYQIRASTFLSKQELPRFQSVMSGLLEKLWPQIKYKDLRRKTQAGFCTFTSYSVPTSMFPILSRISAESPTWFPLIVDAIKPAKEIVPR